MTDLGLQRFLTALFSLVLVAVAAKLGLLSYLLGSVQHDPFFGVLLVVIVCVHFLTRRVRAPRYARFHIMFASLAALFGAASYGWSSFPNPTPVFSWLLAVAAAAAGLAGLIWTTVCWKACESYYDGLLQRRLAEHRAAR